ncbi:MAG: hypothetical protein K6A66_02255 [Streptococcus sp.]|uniref:hypothetical protein n=1 Tax=Streptococcus sp. TaxID=1306 RepID=UPI002587671C|nr:hypothetical protein [Streptococcus sp.]MCR5051504.1 hypothetical protein [Streptococcus sp.]
MTAIVLIIVVAIIFYRRKTKTKTAKPNTDVTVSTVEIEKYLDDNNEYFFDDRYSKLIEKRPDYASYTSGSYDSCYNDSFVTEEGYKLRELLLLVWWGRIKKGRDLDAKIPRYFYERYLINPNNVTKKFFADDLIYVDDEGIVRFTEKGKELQEKYKALWEIHSIKEYPKNLDDDFQDWDYNKFMIKRHKENIEYSKASYKYHKDLLEFFRNFYPKTEDQITYYQDQCTFYLNEIDKLNARIEALQS